MRNREDTSKISANILSLLQIRPASSSSGTPWPSSINIEDRLADYLYRRRHAEAIKHNTAVPTMVNLDGEFQLSLGIVDAEFKEVSSPRFP